jgi:hypothetical protein
LSGFVFEIEENKIMISAMYTFPEYIDWDNEGKDYPSNVDVTNVEPAQALEIILKMKKDGDR